MITSIQFSNFVTEPPPPAPTGNPVGYHSTKVAKPVVPVRNTPVNLNSN